MLISSARLIWPISWATRCEMGACDVTHGHEAPAAEVNEALAEAWPAAAVAGTASSATATPAVSNRAFLDKTRQTRALSITLSSGFGLIPPYRPRNPTRHNTSPGEAVGARWVFLGLFKAPPAPRLAQASRPRPAAGRMLW